MSYGPSTVYIDGQVDPMNATGTALVPYNRLSPIKTALGGIMRGSGQAYVSGMIDDVAVWSRALDPEEVTELYTHGTPVPPPIPQPLAIKGFTSDFPAVAKGGSATISWSVSKDADKVEIEPGIGDVTAQTVAGSGSLKITLNTSVKYWLPAAPAPAQSATKASAPIATPEHIATVLLVEDDASVRRGVKTVLERAGIRVVEAEDGSSAIRIWNEQRPNVDLVFTDMIMPGTLTGLDLARRFQAEKPGLRVILSSGYSLELAASDSLAEKLIVYLPKPCNSTLLLQTVQQCLAQRN